MLEEDDYGDFTAFLDTFKEHLLELDNIDDDKHKNAFLDKNVEFLIDSSNELVFSGDIFDATELLYTGGNLLEELSSEKAFKLYKHMIELWESQIDEYKLQGQIREAAELHVRIADLYRDKFEDKKQEKKHILYSIKHLNTECKLLSEFNEYRKLVQNLQNISELYLRIPIYKKAIKFLEKVIDISKQASYVDILAYSYLQISNCYEELDNYGKSKQIILEAIDYFLIKYQELEEKNNLLNLAEICQILKKLYRKIEDEDQYVYYSKKEASTYINLAEKLEKSSENYEKIARYYRGASLCYKECESNNYIESASCYALAGGYFEKVDDFDQAAQNYSDAAKIFKKLGNNDLAYKHFVKAGDLYNKIEDVNESTLNYLNAYDITVEGNLEFNRFGIFNQIIKGLNKIARDGLKSKQFYTAATLILEGIKFYEQLDDVDELLLKEMVKNVYRYYYRAGNLKNIGYSHIVHSYVLASLSCLLIGQLDKAKKVISEIKTTGATIRNYKTMIQTIIDWMQREQEIEIDNFPYRIRRLIDSSEDIQYLLKLFNRMNGIKIAD